MDKKSAKTILEDLLTNAGFEFNKVDVQETAEDEYYFNIEIDKDAVFLIGRNGDTLVALQQIVKNIFKNNDICLNGEHIKIDVDSYRKNQENNVLQMADKRAKVVEEKGGSTVLPPMSPFFRRLVHMHVKEKYPDLTSSSRGTGNHRAVCISSSIDRPAPMKEGSDLYEDLDL